MSNTFLKSSVRSYYANFPTFKIFKKAGHFFIKLFSLFFIAKTFSIRRITNQNSFRIRCLQICKISLCKIGADNMSIASNHLQSPASHNTGMFRILLGAGNSCRINITACNTNFNICTNFCSFFFSKLKSTVSVKKSKFFHCKATTKSRCNIVGI